jgi:hypothetical protein
VANMGYTPAYRRYNTGTTQGCHRPDTGCGSRKKRTRGMANSRWQMADQCCLLGGLAQRGSPWVDGQSVGQFESQEQAEIAKTRAKGRCCALGNGVSVLGNDVPDPGDDGAPERGHACPRSARAPG